MGSAYDEHGHLLRLQGLPTQPTNSTLKLTLRELEPAAAAVISARKKAWEAPRIAQYAMKACADGPKGFPRRLALNSRLSPIETGETVQQQQPESGMRSLAVDAVVPGTNLRKTEVVIEPLYGKADQFRLVTQIAKILLQIADVIEDFALSMNASLAIFSLQ
jgi:chaperonin GroEL (HSP60 family)